MSEVTDPGSCPVGGEAMRQNRVGIEDKPLAAVLGAGLQTGIGQNFRRRPTPGQETMKPESEQRP